MQYYSLTLFAAGLKILHNTAMKLTVKPPTAVGVLGLILKGEFVSFFGKDFQLDTLVQIKVMKVIRVRIRAEVLLQKITRTVTLTLNMNHTTRSVIFNPIIR